MKSLGFPAVSNENTDFYAAVTAGTTPQHDVLITNPPYSADHLQRIFDYAVKTPERPWCAAPREPS